MEGVGGGKKTIKVLIVEDNPVFLKGLLKLLEYEDDIDVCGITASAAVARTLIGEQSPDLLIADISLGVDNGIDLVRDITTTWPELPVIVLSMHEERLFAKRALRAGARGYLSKQEAPETIVRAIRSVVEGGEFVSDAMSRRRW